MKNAQRNALTVSLTYQAIFKKSIKIRESLFETFFCLGNTEEELEEYTEIFENIEEYRGDSKTNKPIDDDDDDDG